MNLSSAFVVFLLQYFDLQQHSNNLDLYTLESSIISNTSDCRCDHAISGFLYVTQRNFASVECAVKLKDEKMASLEGKCFMSYRDAGECGEFKGKSSLALLSECQNDITAHLKRCHLSKGGIRSEGELILMRAGFFEPTTQHFQMFVCPRHRANLGEYWGNQSRCATCQYPEHKGKLKGVKNERVVSVKIAREVQQMYAIAIPVGTRKSGIATIISYP